MTLETRKCPAPGCKSPPFRVLPSSEQRHCGRSCREREELSTLPFGELWWRPKFVKAAQDRFRKRVRELRMQDPPQTYEQIVRILQAEGIKTGTGREINLSCIGNVCAAMGIQKTRPLKGERD